MKDRYGVAGKLNAFGALSAFTSNLGLTNDWSFFLVRMPNKPTGQETGFPYLWNIQGYFTGSIHALIVIDID